MQSQSHLFFNLWRKSVEAPALFRLLMMDDGLSTSTEPTPEPDPDPVPLGWPLSTSSSSWAKSKRKDVMFGSRFGDRERICKQK